MELIKEENGELIFSELGELITDIYYSQQMARFMHQTAGVGEPLIKKLKRG